MDIKQFEWSLIWCLLDDKYKFEILQKLSEKHFSDKITREIFTFVKDLSFENKTVNKESLLIKFKNYSELIAHNLLPVETGTYHTYLDEIISIYNKNQIKQFGEKLLSGSINEESLYENIDLLIKDLNTNLDSNVLYIENVIDKVTNEILTGTYQQHGILTYIKDLDGKINGFKEGNYVIIAGRPSMGKTSFAIYTAMKNALNGIPVLFFSLEMSHSQILTRMFASAIPIELYKLKRGLLNDLEKAVILEMKAKFKEMPLVIDESTNIDIHDIMAKIQKVKLRYSNLGLVIIDYLQLLNSKGGNQNEAISKISKGLKIIAQKFKIPVMALSQLSRLCEARDNKRPQLSDLRDSGSLEQDSDIVILLYRDHYYNYNPKHESICEINIAKFRDGETGKIVCEYNLRKQYWKSIEHESKLWEIAKKFYDTGV